LGSAHGSGGGEDAALAGGKGCAAEGVEEGKSAAESCDAREFAQGRFGILAMVDGAGSEHLVDGGVPPSGDEGSGPDGGGAPRGAARLGLAWSRRSS
jgi:hypothetical protein